MNHADLIGRIWANKRSNNCSGHFQPRICQDQAETLGAITIARSLLPPAPLARCSRWTRMEFAVKHQHATKNTVFHCLNGFYRLGYTKAQLAHIYDKDVKTIRNWIHVYESTGTYERASHETNTTYSREHQQWLVQFYQRQPLAYLDEAAKAFKEVYCIAISKTSVWRLIHEAGLTWKVLERRAMHIKERDVHRFAEELSHINWCHDNLVFLDEVSRGVSARNVDPHWAWSCWITPRSSLSSAAPARSLPRTWIHAVSNSFKSQFLTIASPYLYTRRSATPPRVDATQSFIASSLRSLGTGCFL